MLSEKDLYDKIKNGNQGRPNQINKQLTKTFVSIEVQVRPGMTFEYDHSSNPPTNDGLDDNVCWPRNIAVGDPGFALLTLDEWYDTNRRGQVKGPDGRYGKTRWNYNKPYKQGTNGD